MHFRKGELIASFCKADYDNPQSRTEQSSEPEASSRPSGENATLRTLLPCSNTSLRLIRSMLNDVRAGSVGLLMLLSAMSRSRLRLGFSLSSGWRVLSPELALVEGSELTSPSDSALA